MSAVLPCRVLAASTARRSNAVGRNNKRSTTTVQGRKTQVRFYSEAFNFGKMVKDKPEKAEGGQKKSIEDSYWSAASEDEKRRREDISSARAKRLAEAALKKSMEQQTTPETPAAAAAAAAATDAAAPTPAATAEPSAESTPDEAAATDAADDVDTPVVTTAPPKKKMSPNEMEFWQFAAREREEYENETAEANDPCFSVRAQQAAWQLHKSNPGMHFHV